MGKKGNKAKTQELDDDALLDAAILVTDDRIVTNPGQYSLVACARPLTSQPFAQENKELRAKLPQEVKKTGGAPSKGRRSNLNHNNAPLPELKTLTMQETLAKLDRVMIFSIFRMLPDGSKDICPSSDGVVTFYAGAADVQVKATAAYRAHRMLLPRNVLTVPASTCRRSSRSSSRQNPQLGWGSTTCRSAAPLRSHKG